MQNIEKSFLKLRGIDEANIKRKLFVEKKDIPSALEFDQAIDFINRLTTLIEKGDRIVVLGDYDCDGISGTIVAVRMLRTFYKLAGHKENNISYYIPDRFEDGYGISEKVINKIQKKNPKVKTIITVDNGIVAMDAVNYAKSKGFEVIITDHHKSLDVLPAADIIINPNKIGDNYPFKGICGTTVIYKLLLELANRLYPESLSMFEQYIDFVGLATVADVMPVLEENRYYIQEAVNVFNGTSRFKLRYAWCSIIQQLLLRNKVSKDKVFTETDFGFTFGPIINAQSRVYGSANTAVDTFLSLNTDNIQEKTKFLVDVNEKRKSDTAEFYEILMQEDHSNKSVVIVRNDAIGEGYIGLLAGKLAEYYNRPTIVFSKNKDYLKGSGRCSVPGVSIIDILRKHSNLFEKLGGHNQALGCSIKEENLEELSNVLEKEFESVIPEDLSSELIPEFIIDADYLNEDFLESINKFAPFGKDFEYPVLGIENLNIDSVLALGKEKNHLKILSDNLEIISWNAIANLEDIATSATSFDVVGKPEINTFRGKKSIQIIAPEKGLKFY